MCANLIVIAWMPQIKRSKIAEVLAKNPTVKGVKRVGRCPYASPTDRGVRIYSLLVCLADTIGDRIVCDYE